MNNRKYPHPLNAKKQVEIALIQLEDLHFDLRLSSRTLNECRSLIHTYYMNNPESKVNTRTIVGSITYLVSMRNNELISLASIANNLEISPSWLAKKKKEIASDLGFSSSFY